MECIEFRKKIEQKQEPDFEILSSHLDSCNICNRWLNDTLHKTPQALKKPQLEELPFSYPEHIFPGPIPWLRNLFKPLSISLAFAVCLVLFFWFPASTPMTEVNFSNDYSFLENEKNLKQVSFMQPITKPVTRRTFSDSYSWSFLEKENSYSFLNEEGRKYE
ncbi:hypothetical protein ACFL35_12235 [Candidatus Riflebacteria bacterium]